jgi:hypothetical protein
MPALISGVHLVNNQTKNKNMKTIFALSTVILMTLSLNGNAAVKSSDFSNDLPKSMVSVAPFVWGSPDDQAPEGLRFVKARFAKVPVAPFVWGSPDDIIDSGKSVKGFKNLNVPVAPFVWGSPDETAPESLKNIKAENANVPVAPFVWGNPEEVAPEILNIEE